MSEYRPEQDIAENLRFYGDMRFKQLTLLMAWLTISGAGVMQSGKVEIVPDLQARVIIAMASIIVGSVLWVMEIRSSLSFVAHRSKFPDLWPRPENVAADQVNATNMVLILYCSHYLAWLWLLDNWIESYLLILSLSLFFSYLVVFSILSYVPLWQHKENKSSDRADGN